MSTPEVSLLASQLRLWEDALMQMVDECVRISNRHEDFKAAQPSDCVLTRNTSALRKAGIASTTVYTCLYGAVGRSLCTAFLKEIYLTAHFMPSSVASGAACDIFVTTLQIIFAVSVNLLILGFLAMSFFYGLKIILVTPEDVSGNAPSAISIDETTILPGM
jgi:hypothetical protein